jgi:hypothetical protein
LIKESIMHDVTERELQPTQRCVILQNTPYRRLDVRNAATEDGGVLAAGTHLWTNDISEVGRARQVRAIAEGLGPILIEGNILKCVE